MVATAPNLQNILFTAHAEDEKPVPVNPVTPDIWKKMLLQDRNSDRILGFAATQKFEARPGQILVIPDNNTGAPERVIVGVGSFDDMWALSTAAATLPGGLYKISPLSLAAMKSEQLYKMTLGWALARYPAFKIRDSKVDSAPVKDGPKLQIAKALLPRYDELATEIAATWRTRDLINAPTNILNTRQLAVEVVKLAKEFNAAANVLNGLTIEKHFPLLHAVGRASSSPPLLAHLEWKGSGASENAPAILLVGKGVTFDTGGVQIKPGDSMKTMKKDMGGAATAMGLARMIMGNDLPVKLKLVIPTAENSVSANAFRPQDVIVARDGTTVEIGHTDAEGRLILADALTFGIEGFNPDYILDFATLTGAQRVADGTEVGGLFSNDRALGRKLEDVSEQWNDQLQLHHFFETYRRHLKSEEGAELNSSSGSGPGATIAAMFLQHFTRAAKEGAKWFHFDINGGNVSALPGRPKGGEAMGMRAAYRFLKAELNL